jgi:hypothetical protein
MENCLSRYTGGIETLTAFFRDRNISQSAIDRLNWMLEILSSEFFKKLFPAALTDNGSEFSNPKAFYFVKLPFFIRTAVVL